MKIIHFDVGKVQEHYVRNLGHEYTSATVNQYIQSNGTFQAEIVTGFPTSKFDRDTIDSIEGLRLIITRSVGVDSVDEEYCKQKGIKFINIRYSYHNVVHHTLAFILFYTRQLAQSFKRVQSGEFCHENIDCLDLGIRTLGIIGYGRIGKEVAQMADALGLKVIAYDRKYNHGDFIDGFELYDFEDLIQIADIISLHCDANPTSMGMINDETIGQMKDDVALINTARGSLIKEKDLIKNIDKFSFVGLDVLEDEVNFDKNHDLLKFPNVFITPHTAYKSEVTTKERWDKTFEYIKNFMKESNS